MSINIGICAGRFASAIAAEAMSMANLIGML